MITWRIGTAVAAAALTAALSSCAASTPAQRNRSQAYTGPVSWLLHASTDLGAARDPEVSVVVALAGRAHPTELLGWARDHGLRVQWSAGADWAALSGTPRGMSAAFSVRVHDYRSHTGHPFYAAQRQPAVPSALAGQVSQVGRIVSYAPRQLASGLLADAPPNGFDPQQLITAYRATALAAAGYTGRGSTIVFFEWSPPLQADLDAFDRRAGLPSLTPTVVGRFDNPPQGAIGETEMDLEVAHAIAPQARLVIVDANPTEGPAGTLGQRIATMFTATEAQFPGAVWSSSIGWGCDRDFTAADLLPAEDALAQAERTGGTTAFDAAGDTAGLECKGSQDYAAPPQQSDVGVDAVASLPAMTSVGGTLLSTDNAGRWVAEEAWISSSASQGTGGGIDPDIARPSWQDAQGVPAVNDSGHRLVPDVAADADPNSGVATVLQGQPSQGGGTSQSAPIWAGLTTLMDEYLQAHGGQLIGAINPMLYRIARGASRPAFHDVTLGGNAVYRAALGYDPVTGLGTPVTDNLAADILDVQKGSS
jgi:kumamolisin